MTLDAFKTAAQRKFGEMADQYLQLYPAASDADAQRAAHEACADEINWNMRQWAAAQAKLGKKAYTYFFTRIPTLNGQPSPQGATHTAEISYAFNNPKGQADADVERDRSRSSPTDVVLLGELHHEGRSERQRPAAVAAVQGPRHEQGHGAGRYAAGGIGAGRPRS